MNPGEVQSRVSVLRSQLASLDEAVATLRRARDLSMNPLAHGILPGQLVLAPWSFAGVALALVAVERARTHADELIRSLSGEVTQQIDASGSGGAAGSAVGPTASRRGGGGTFPAATPTLQGSASGFAGGKADSHGELTVDWDGAALDAGAEASYGAEGEASVEASAFGVVGKANAEGFVGGKANADVTYSLDADGYKSTADAQAMVGAEGSAAVEVDMGDYTHKTEVSGYAKAEAGAEAETYIGPNGVSMKAGVALLAGVGASVGQSLTSDYGTMSVEVGAVAGVGFDVAEELSLTYDKLGASVDLGAALGEGASLQVDLFINPRAMVDDVLETFGF